MLEDMGRKEVGEEGVVLLLKALGFNNCAGFMAGRKTESACLGQCKCCRAQKYDSFRKDWFGHEGPILTLLMKGRWIVCADGRFFMST